MTEHLACAVVAYRDILRANSERASRRGADSPLSHAETRLLQHLYELGLKPELQAELGPYDADLFFRDAGLCVEIDGAHHDRDRDRFRDGYLAARGITTLRVPARDVWDDAATTARVVRRFVLEGLRQP